MEKLAKTASTIPKRTSNKSQPDFDYSIRKQKFRENCFRRVREDRTRLLWKLRISDCQSSDQKEIINCAFQDIVSDELKKIEDSSRNLSGNKTLTEDCDDILWEYEEGLKGVYEGDSEEILLEMQQIFYKDLLSETNVNGSFVQVETWEDEEDDYLAALVSQNMCLNSEQEESQIWCPICKKGELMENHRHIDCNMCDMQLNKGEEVNLNILQERLAEAHGEHLQRGCRLKPEFSVQSVYNLKALYITCEACKTFEVVV
ncbi:RPA-interacting protein A [Arabidopsis thaliana]|uniref:RPA-interacting protein A n=1 Tax=Arabidopsis thaliana TaxID=3702 RepID=F4JRF6_ARATH|nr:RPA-interacting protein A [Arabidopsis thaliana]AEE83176.1 RPA-interacting protein A [Arabidopsis thaliana]|eukprot:NP_193012.2 RPA-interacting protein A [Arabidopsis thaliana]